ncbi:protein of unknown function [Magnetospirillum sp. XM-1]|nr:protein of unknown function [Magnetospirillum sp. XM-1]
MTPRSGIRCLQWQRHWVVPNRDGEGDYLRHKCDTLTIASL